MIKGLNGCSCHPFSSWEECNKAHRQKFKVGDPVKNRCTGRDGTINKVEKLAGYVSVKYGPIPRDIHGEHVAQLIRIHHDTIEKANEIFNFYFQRLQGYLPKHISKQEAIKMALYHVDGMLTVIPMYTGNLNPIWDFYRIVKTELKSML